MVVPHLVLSNFLARKARVALTVAAVALSVSLVVAVTTGYHSVEGAVHRFIDQYMGATDAQIVRQNDPRGRVSEAVVEALRKDRAVAKVNGRVEIDTAIDDKAGKRVEGRSPQVFGISVPGDSRVDTLQLEKGRWFKTSDAAEAVLDQALAEEIKADLGSTVTLKGNQDTKLTVVGIVHKPELIAAQVWTIYAPLRTLQKHLGPEWGQPPFYVNRITIELQKGTDPRKWADGFTPALARLDPAARLRLSRDTRAEVDKNLGSIRLLSYLGGTVSMLAATFIVFSALAMGVAERQRTLAMLRAVGAVRSQIGLLVLFEGLILSVIGVAVGVPLGLFWVQILTWKFGDVFTAGVTPDWWGVVFGATGSVLTALAAGALPAWLAARVSPLEAMNPDSTPPPARTPFVAAAVGLLLAAIDPFLIFGPVPWVVNKLGLSHPAETVLNIRFYGHFALGLPGLMTGFFLLGPLFVGVVERVIGPAVARLLGLNPALLRQQLSSGLWRAAGTAAALMVGLAFLVVMQVQGNSALSGWQLPTKFPDIFIVSPPSLASIWTPSGIAFGQEQQIEQVPGIIPGQVMPIAIAFPKLGSGLFAVPQILANPDATIFFGIDPDRAFKMMELEFRDGTQDNAQRLLKDGKDVTLVPGQAPDPADAALDAAGTAVVRTRGVTYDPAAKKWALHGLVADRGDGYEITLPRGETRRLPKAAVESVEDGRFLIVTNEFKELKGLVTGDPFQLERSDGKKANYTICGVVWSPGIDVIVGVFDMGRQFDQRTAASVFGAIKDARRDFAVERVYLFAANLQYGVEREEVLDRVKKQLHNQGLKAGDVRHIKAKIVGAFYRILYLVSSVAFAAMAVASLGVTNTVMAGIRTRRWQFGVLRSIGVTRGQLLRLVLSEAILLGLVACAMGLSAGGLMTLDAHRLGVIVTGYNPAIAVPWGVVGIGTGVVMAIGLLASLWPAISVARSEPLALLQAGRAAA